MRELSSVEHTVVSLCVNDGSGGKHICPHPAKVVKYDDGSTEWGCLLCQTEFPKVATEGYSRSLFDGLEERPDDPLPPTAYGLPVACSTCKAAHPECQGIGPLRTICTSVPCQRIRVEWRAAARGLARRAADKIVAAEAEGKSEEEQEELLPDIAKGIFESLRRQEIPGEAVWAEEGALLQRDPQGNLLLWQEIEGRKSDSKGIFPKRGCGFALEKALATRCSNCGPDNASDWVHMTQAELTGDRIKTSPGSCTVCSDLGIACAHVASNLTAADKYRNLCVLHRMEKVEAPAGAQVMELEAYKRMLEKERDLEPLVEQYEHRRDPKTLFRLSFRREVELLYHTGRLDFEAACGLLAWLGEWDGEFHQSYDPHEEAIDTLKKLLELICRRTRRVAAFRVGVAYNEKDVDQGAIDFMGGVMETDLKRGQPAATEPIIIEVYVLGYPADHKHIKALEALLSCIKNDVVPAESSWMFAAVQRFREVMRGRAFEIKMVGVGLREREWVRGEGGVTRLLPADYSVKRVFKLRAVAGAAEAGAAEAGAAEAGAAEAGAAEAGAAEAGAAEAGAGAEVAATEEV